jgi:protein tyrosine phosphatase|tara:strand:+ start:234 stop:704 length:471 start_codon:yes stop_codon:yes gene_type:complete
VSDFLKKDKCPLSKNDIAKEYDVLDQLFEQDEVIKHLLQDTKGDYQQRNRYSDILTYYKSRVKLARGQTSSYVDSDYINACYVNSPIENPDGTIYGDKKIIASQGPLPQTTDHFWQMILENNVTMIVSTCKTSENGRTKCNKFWPDKNNGNKHLIS